MSGQKIKLLPITRLTMTFDLEMGLDRRGVFGKDTYDSYLQRQIQSEARLQGMIRSLFLTDAAIRLLISGQKFTIPGVGLEVSQIPAVNEILLFSSALSFFFLCAAFITNQCYAGSIEQFGNRIVDHNQIDPDFFNASRKHYDYFLKVFRHKLNIWGEDFYRSGTGFKAFSWLMYFITILVLLSFPAAHSVVSGWSAIVIFNSDMSIYGKSFILSSVAIINLGAFLMVFGAYKSFTFTVWEPEDSTPLNSQNPKLVDNE